MTHVHAVTKARRPASAKPARPARPAQRRALRPEELLRCDDAPAAWGAFDPDWYLAAYPEIRDEVADRSPGSVLRFYLTEGQARRHSPNVFFDETWYLTSNPDAARLVRTKLFRSGFDHYCASGHTDRSAHWLYDDALYLQLNPDLAYPLPGFLDRYDHYLRHGSAEDRQAHILFDPRHYRAGVGADLGGAAPFRHFLQRLHAATGNAETSPYFDAEWYRYRYAVVDAAIRGGRWLCALHHYLCNDSPGEFDPLCHFSEQFYRDANPDILPALQSGTLRSGYQHFLFHGVFELRPPAAFIDLRPHRPHGSEAAPAPRDAFAQYLRQRRAEPAPAAIPDEAQAQALFVSKARRQLSHLARRTLQFGSDGPPEISVIMVARNRFALTMTALASLRANFAGAIELILVDSGSSDETRRIARHVAGAVVLRFENNIGFVRGSNAGMAHVSAPAVLLLNNDVELAPGAVGAALDRLRSDAGIGAVGGKVVRTHGLLQEAGSIIWRDGHACGYLRDAPADCAESDFVRDVDYCSGVFLLVRAAALQALGGFDEAFAPAYYEDADLCARLWQAGYRVVYDPAVQLTHHEYGSAGSAEAAAAMMGRNQALFAAKHRAWLRRQYAQDPKLVAFARAAGRPRRRVLFIEDTVPLRNAGAGYVRANDIVREMAGLGCHVTIFPVNGCRFDPARVFADLPDTVEVLHDRTIADLPEFLQSRADYYDVVWVSRAHNLDKSRTALERSCGDPNRVRVVLDTEAVFSLRELAHATLTGAPFDLDRALGRELANAWFCQHILAVSEPEAELLRGRLGLSDVALLGTMRACTPTPRPFGGRNGLLFVGALHHAQTPNYDSLCWFIDKVMPLLRTRLGSAVQLTVAGFAEAEVDVKRWLGRADIRWLGEVDDLQPLYDRHRVFVAPTRYAAGTPYKVYEAASYGLPVVTSELLASQLGWSNGAELMAADIGSPRAFADAIAACYGSAELWHGLRGRALSRLARENSPVAFRARLAEIIGVTQDEPRQTREPRPARPRPALVAAAE